MKRKLVLTISLLFLATSCGVPALEQAEPPTISGITVTAAIRPLEPTATPNIKPAAENRESASETKPFKISSNMEIEQGVATWETFFVDNYVIETVETPHDVEVIFDLARQSWKDLESNQTTLFTVCEAWVQASIKRTRTSLATTKDAAVKHFVETILEPNLQVSLDTQGVLTLENDVVVYKITSSQELSAEMLERYFAYERMNACRKAMVQKTIPPTTQYEMLDELKQRSMYPNEIHLTMTLKDVTTTEITSTIADMTNSELATIESLLSEQK